MSSIRSGCRAVPHWSLLIVALVVAASLSPALASAQSTPVPQARSQAAVYSACAECHEATVESFGASAHGRAWHYDDHFSAASCESCHGDATRHIEAGDGSNIVNPRRLDAAKAAELCMSCHQGALAQAHWEGSVHQRRGVTCIDCHNPHAAAPADSMVNTGMQTELCYNCHQDKRSEMQKVSHHPVREGKITCFSCHDPHGGITKPNLRTASVNELCYQCHTEKRGPFLWEHAPVRENCLNCHTPHGSNHLKLQSTSVPFLCQQCHGNTRHPASLYDAGSLPTLESPDEGNNRIFNRACVDCHAAIHGSNNPSGPYLGR